MTIKKDELQAQITYRLIESLSTSEKRYETLVENLQEVVFESDLKGIFKFLNSTWERALGYSIEESLGRSLYDFVFEDNKESCLKLFNFGKEQRNKQNTLRFLHKKGHLLWLVVSVTTDGKGNVSGSLHDITELRKTTVSKDYVDNIIKSMIDTLIVATPNGKIKTVNRATCDLLGYKEEELIGKDVSLLFPEDERKPLGKTMFEKLIEEGQRANYEINCKAKDSRKIPALFSGSVMRDESSNITDIVCVARDITERKKAEEALAERTQELARSNAELQRFVYVASHDLQEPLRMVTSYVQLLEKRYKDKLDTDAKEFIGFAVDGSQRIRRLIKDLWVFSRVGTRGKPFELTDCESILNLAIINLQVAIKETKAAVTHDPLPRVMADNIQLVQLFQNLIDNAVRFRGKELPRVHFSAKKEKNYWVFSVHDNGIGIDLQKYKDKIFQIFQRIHSRAEYLGAGIGLSVCRKIVERHGGQIWVKSEPGKGSTFYFTIPVLKKEVAP